jgi:hypothetical protein
MSTDHQNQPGEVRVSGGFARVDAIVGRRKMPNKMPGDVPRWAALRALSQGRSGTTLRNTVL